MDRRFLLSLAPAVAVLALARRARSAESGLLAVDVLLEPDDALADRARALNARLRASERNGFPLDETHVPHLSLVQQFVRREDVGRLGELIAKVLEASPAPMQIEVTGIDLAPWNRATMVSLAVERNAVLSRLQAALITSLIPFVAPAGDANAFVRDAPDSQIDTTTIDYVSSFLLKHAGDSYQPHVTVGLASKAAAQALKAEPFERRSYGVSRAAVYQLGNAGTARRRLWP